MMDLLLMVRLPRLPVFPIVISKGISTRQRHGDGERFPGTARFFCLRFLVCLAKFGRMKGLRMRSRFLLPF